MQTADAFVLGPGAVLFYTVARTGVGAWLSFRGHAEREPGSSLALQALSDGILVMGAILYANEALRPEAPRVLMAALLVYAVTWESYTGLSRLQAAEREADEVVDPSSVLDDFVGIVGGFGWMFMTLMLIALSGMVVASRAELTDSQKLAPIVGVGLPIVIGFAVRGWIGYRRHEGWSFGDSVVAIVASGALAFSTWAWL